MKQTTKKTFGIYWEHARRYKLVVWILHVGVALGVFLSVYVPQWYKRFFDVLAANNAGLETELVKILLVILGLNFAQFIVWRIASFLNTFFQPRVISDLHITCFEYMQKHSYNFFSNNFTGSLVKKVGRYVRAFEDIMDQITWELGPVAWRAILILGFLFASHPMVAFVMLIWMAVYVGFNIWFARFKLPMDVATASHDTKTAGHLADVVTNNMNLKLFGGFNRELKTHSKLAETLFRLRRRSWTYSQTAESIQAGLMVVLEFAAFYIAIRLWRQGVFTLGDFALLQTYVVQLFSHFWNLGSHLRRIYERLADAEEMTEILITPHEVRDAPGAGSLVVKAGQIEFKNTRFAYYDKLKILSNFNLLIKPGEKVALIGPSGGGKSTIVKLLFRFMDIQGGEILVDGQNIAGLTQDSLRQNIALVPQEPILFHRSLIENIAYAKPSATRAEVISAAKFAHCHEFISSFPDGYETFVGERGIKLSGGERQRVAIARAILMDAPIVVFDEATSNLDSESESMIQDALKKLLVGRTTLVIAHRLSTIRQMDRIIVLDNGRIIEEGRHKELMKAEQGLYQKLWDIQAGAFS